jgi:hypothetical protein
MITPLALIKKTIHPEFYVWTCCCDVVNYLVTHEAKYYRRRDKIYCSACGMLHRPRFTERHSTDTAEVKKEASD